jgi:hypothetical protein
MTIMLTWKLTWFDKADIIYAIISKSKHSWYAIISKSKHSWWRDNNYTEKLVTERLSHITYDFPNIWRIIAGC